MSDIDLSDLEGFEKEVEEPSSEGSLERERRIFDKSYSLIKEAMSNVIQEILVTLEDGTNHIVYINGLNLKNNELSVDFSTPSENRKADLYPHVVKCVKIQIEEIIKSYKPKKWYNFFSRG